MKVGPRNPSPELDWTVPCFAVTMQIDGLWSWMWPNCLYQKCAPLKAGRRVKCHQWSTNCRKHRRGVRGSLKTHLGLPKSPSFGNFIGLPMSKILETGSAVGFLPPFCRAVRTFLVSARLGMLWEYFFWWYFGISSSAHTQSRKCRSTTFSSLCTGFFL